MCIVVVVEVRVFFLCGIFIEWYCEDFFFKREEFLWCFLWVYEDVVVLVVEEGYVVVGIFVFCEVGILWCFLDFESDFVVVEVGVGVGDFEIFWCFFLMFEECGDVVWGVFIFI